MKFNLKNLLLISVLLISLNFLVTAPSAAFSSDSFAQDSFDSFTWRFTTCPGVVFNLFSEGDLMKVGVVAAINENYEGVFYDTLYLFYYNQSAGNSDWTPFILNEYARYNGTVYVYPNFGYGILPVLIPHNATAVINALDNWYSTHTSLDNSSWVAGPNGYDGTYSIWEGSGAEEPDAWKDEFSFNSEGVMESCSMYNSTGSDWNLLIKFELESASEIPGFPIYTTCIAFGLSLIMVVVLLRKKEIL